MKGTPTFNYPSTFARTPVMSRHNAISSGHYLATAAGFELLAAGGNAIDAGVAAGISQTVLRPDYVSFGGIAPILIYQAASGEVSTIAGVGHWPKRSSFEYLTSHYGTKMPLGVLRTTIPALPDAWFAALAKFGRASFEEVAKRPLQYAEDGFPMYKTMFDNLRDKKAAIEQLPTTAARLLPGGNVPELGEMFAQKELAEVIKKMIDAERRAKSRGRLAGLQAARDEFYKGSIARRIVEFYADEKGWLAADDLAEFSSKMEAPAKIKFREYEIYTCGFWSQGPVLLQALKILENYDLAAWGEGTGTYLHTLTEAIKLAFSDREAFYGDPLFINVPGETLLSAEYASARRELLRDQAWPEMPPHGRPDSSSTAAGDIKYQPSSGMSAITGTDHVSVIDGEGNIFSATPSDLTTDAVMIPGLGFAVSSRGAQSRLIAEHPNAMAPGKRPCVTTIPALVMRDGKPFMTLGTPGGDSQVQAMLQVILNVTQFRMDPQRAVEAARLISFSFPAAFAPHDYQPGVVKIEDRMAAGAIDEMQARGHKVQVPGGWFREAGGICAIAIDPRNGVRWAAADPRRETAAIAC